MRKIIHFDLDAFFASVEQRDRPFLRGKPVIVCNVNNGRSVVSTASYEARRYGVFSAQPVFKAKKLCPKGYFVSPNFDKYREVSDSVYEIFYKYTDIVEAAGLDEAYIDVTQNKFGIPSATWIAKDICYEVFNKVGLTISAGVSTNKLVAKIASDENKPNGITVVKPENIKSFLSDMPVRKIPGIGPATESMCWGFNIKQISDFLKYDQRTLDEWFGKNGEVFRNCALGIDNRALSVDHICKSCGIEDTLSYNVKDVEDILIILENLSKALEKRLLKKNISGRTVILKIKYENFQSITRRITLPQFINDWSSLFSAVKDLIGQTEIGRKEVRLLGISMTQLRHGVGELLPIQPLLFK